MPWEYWYRQHEHWRLKGTSFWGIKSTFGLKLQVHRNEWPNSQITSKEHLLHLWGQIQCFNEFRKSTGDTQTIRHYSPISGSSALNLFTSLIQITILAELHQQLENRIMRLGPLLYHEMGNKYSLVNCVSQPNKSAAVQKTHKTLAKAWVR